MTYQRTLDLYELLPVLYRMQDSSDQGYPLRALLEIVSEQAEAIRDDIQGLDDLHFIELCPEWAVPYIGELVGSGQLPIGARRRIVVAKAIHYRRRKGTLSMLEELARDATGWGARVQPFAPLLGWTQNVEHPRDRNDASAEVHDPYAGNSPGTVDLRDPNNLDRLNGPFFDDNTSHTVDTRPMGLERGYYNLGKIGFFLWRLRSYPVRGATPHRAAPPNDHGYHFSPLGNPMPLFTKPEPTVDGTERVGEINVPGPIRPGALAQDLEAALRGSSQSSTYCTYYGSDRSLYVVKYRDKPVPSEGVDYQPVPPQDVIYQDLHSWDRPISGKVAVDVRLGRLSFAEGEEPAGGVRVDYNYGFSANMGGGPYYRRLPRAMERPPEVPDAKPVLLWEELEGYDCFPTLREALERWRTSGSGSFAVIQIAGSQTFQEDLEITYAEDPESPTFGRELVIQAAQGQRPTLIGHLAVSGLSDRNRLTLHGLVISGCIEVKRGLAGLNISHCTLVPGGELDEEGKPRQAGRPSVLVQPPSDSFRLWVDHSIVGPLRLPSGAALEVADSIVDSPRTDATIIPALVSGNLIPFPGLGSDSPRVDVTMGDEDTHTAIFPQKATTLAEARDQLEIAIRSAHDSPAFAGARVVLAGNWLVVLSGSGVPVNITTSGPDNTARDLRLDPESSQQLYAFRGGMLTAFSGLAASSPAINVTIGAEGPHTAELEDRPSTLAQARDKLERAIRSAHDSLAFTAANVAIVEDRLLVLPGTPEAMVFSSAPDDQTTLGDLALEGNRPAIAATDSGQSGPTARSLERATIFGQVRVRELPRASEVIFTDPVIVQHRQTGEARYCYVPEGSQTPDLRRFCQPDLALTELRADQRHDGPSRAEEDRIRVRLRPVFTSSGYGQPGYAQLDPGCDKGILTGAEDGSEMGVFRNLGQSQRAENLRELLEEYLPLGLQAGFIYVT